MKKVFKLSLATAVILFIAVIACKKSNSSSLTDAQLQTKVTQNSSDQTLMQTDDETISNDVLTRMDTTSSFITLTVSDSLKRNGILIDKSQWATAHILTFTYFDSLTNTTPIRSGTVTVQFVNYNATSCPHWYDAGAILKETINGVKVLNGVAGYTYNVVRYVTNVNGGLIFNPLALPVKDTVEHKVRVTGTVTFEDGTTRTWWAARDNKYYKDVTYHILNKIQSAGDTTVNSVLCTMGGITRAGDAFLLQAPQPIVSTSSCGFYNPVAGIRIYDVDNHTVTLTLGIDTTTGIQVTSGCANGYKVDWTRLSGLSAEVKVGY